MNDFFLQATNSGNWFLEIIEKFNPISLPHDAFVTDLAIIMILAGVVTLAFFKIRQPLIIGYLFAGMLIGPLSPLWTSFFVIDPEQVTGAIGILSDGYRVSICKNSFNWKDCNRGWINWIVSNSWYNILYYKPIWA